MTIVLGFFCLFFLILFHEAGHFAAAKFFGVKVESFSIGFGPVLLRKKIHDTEYRFSLIPLGGYCGMKGEKDFQKALEENRSEINGEPDSFYGVHPVKRALIAFSGPLFNVIGAFFGFFLIALLGFSYYSYPSKIILADELDPAIYSSAREAGLLTGDQIIRINKKEIENFSDMILEISSRPEETLEIEVLRNNEKLIFNCKTILDKKSGAGKIGVSADVNQITKYEKAPLSFFKAILEGIKETGNSIALTFRGIFTLFKGVNVSESIAGPARTADLLGSVVKESFKSSIKNGIINLASFTAFINISLFIMNLLPVPVLDGGLILFAMIEAIFRKKISPKVLQYIQFIGIAFIVFLFILGSTGDIKYFSNRFRGIQK